MLKEDVLTIADVIRQRAKDRGEGLVFTFEGDEMTYSQLDAGSNRAANGLMSLGVQKGDRIAYMGKNSHWYFEILLGAAKLGAVMTPVNWRLAPPEVAYIVNDCQAKTLFIGPEFVDLARQIKPDLKHVETIFCSEENSAEFPGYPDWRDEFSNVDPMVACAPDDDALQLYTSGTTGHPKGAVMTGASIFASRAKLSDDDLADWQKSEPGDTMLLAMPCFHIGGTGSGLGNIYSDGHAVIVREYDPAQALDFIEQYGINKIFMVPAAIQILLNHPRVNEVDFSKLQYITYGASPIPLELMKQSIDTFGCGFVQMYGMTETTGTIVALPPEDHDPNGNEKMRSVGKPLPGVEVKIIDEQGNSLPPREVGEIATRSSQNMKGYWNMPEATAATIDADGWLRTGDAGYFDEDGYLYIHDRVKDMIISGGENIYPAEVENAIYGHPAVADVAVIGVPDERWGEAVKACVVLKDSQDVSEADIISHARKNIAGFKCPKSVDFIPALPRNPSGKILRRELRSPYWDGKDRAVN
ncbi:fatty acid--CoA ligase [Parasphingorhabdus sp. JC815]|uniref:fatty acid--CoA ligase n=1 Tax=Parasphingorhabdus sp. JC815 TaxID=3232140 RepID=UPI00345B4C47